MKEVAVGRWWKSDRYQLVDGYIRPAGRAAFGEIDPWEHFSAGPDARVSEPPYVELANLLAPLPTPAEQDDQVVLDADQERALLDWCSRYGLLGLLPEMVELVEITSLQPAEKEGFVEVLSSTTRRYGDEWRQLSGQSLGVMKKDEVGRLRRDALVNAAWLGDPGVESLSKTWAGFFPDVSPEERETYEYPMPLTKEFWREYAEPIVDFIRVGKFFTQAITRLNDPDAKDAPGILGVTMTRKRALDVLNGFIESTVPVLQPDDSGNLQRTWRSPSLLGMLAMMATEDRLGERRLYRCLCGRQIASTYLDTKYCSPQHREKYRKRAQRERERKGRKGRARRPASRKAGGRTPGAGKRK